MPGVREGTRLQLGMVGAAMLGFLTNPERYRMKRLTEWVNLIAVVIRLTDAILRAGWL